MERKNVRAGNTEIITKISQIIINANDFPDHPCRDSSKAAAISVKRNAGHLLHRRENNCCIVFIPEQEGPVYNRHTDQHNY